MTSDKFRQRYAHFSPAVRLGHALATVESLRDKEWSEVEGEARRRWAAQQDRPWPEYETVVHQAWQEAKAQFEDEADSHPDGPEARFRRHYQANYDSDAYDYGQYAAAYHYGYDLGVDQRLSRQSWADIEPKAKEHWNNQTKAAFWDEFAGAIHFGWQQGRQTISPPG